MGCDKLSNAHPAGRWNIPVTMNWSSGTASIWIVLLLQAEKNIFCSFAARNAIRKIAGPGANLPLDALQTMQPETIDDGSDWSAAFPPSSRSANELLLKKHQLFAFSRNGTKFAASGTRRSISGWSPSNATRIIFTVIEKFGAAFPDPALWRAGNAGTGFLRCC